MKRPFGIPMGEFLTLVFFCLTCAQAALLKPYVTLVPGEPANVFTGLLCAVSFFLACIVAWRRRLELRTPAPAVTFVLLALATVSAFLSSARSVSLFRVFVAMASGIGGFWSARILFRTEPRRRFLVWLCAGLLAILWALSLLGFLIHGRIETWLDANPHPVMSRFLLLSFAPLALALDPKRAWKRTGILMLCLGVAPLFLSALRSAVLIPIVVMALAFLFHGIRRRHFFVVATLSVLVVAGFFRAFPDRKLKLDQYEPVYYRVENYAFSWHIASQHPWFGHGLLAPRTPFLADYPSTFPYANRAAFTDSAQRIVVSENIFLTWLADLGIPFLVLYLTGLTILSRRLYVLTRLPRNGEDLPPAALLLALTAALLHFLIFDGLVHPQVSWFFHVLLGLIPGSAETRRRAAGLFTPARES